LKDYKDVLEFEAEHPLTEEPLRIDVVIVKKRRDIVIQKNIANIFKEHNILEYKSPGGHASVSDLQKTFAYVYLYAFIHKITVTDLSLTIVETAYSRKLIRHLKDVYHFSVEEPFEGIHIVTGNVFPLQIIESKKLSASDNLWLRSLSNRLSAEELKKIERERVKQGKEANLNAYMRTIIQANFNTAKEVIRMGSSSLQEVVEELIEEGYFKELVNKLETRKDAETARKMLLDGQSSENVAKWLELPLDKVRQIQENLHH
jgi:hypothetical protein